METHILVTGASGNVGLPAVRDLASRGLKVRALTRDPNRAGKLKISGVEVITAELGRPVSVNNALRDITHVLLISPVDSRMVEMQEAVVDAARRAGVKHVVKLSVLGAATNAPVAMFRWHREIEEQLERSGVAWTHLRAAFFMQNTLGFAPTIRSQGAIFACMKRGRVAMVDARDVARAAAAVLAGKGHEGKAYDVTGPEALSLHDVADRLAGVLRQQVLYVDQPPARLVSALLANEVPEWLAKDLTALYEYLAQGKMAQVSRDFATLTGDPPANFDRFAEDYVGMFRGM
ncbi:MAG TPA: SDR family oxidoreductase [Gemmatimonadales bacterium]|nr:SDR family oxidoreductase [Gemmatimonadales bacterium]